MFERTIAKQLSLWISSNKNPDLLWRSAGSGGRSTMRRKKTGKGIENAASDLAPLHKDAEPFTSVFTVECKHYKALTLGQIVYDFDKSTVARWWAQAERDARSVDRSPLLIMKENNRQPLIALCPPLMTQWRLLAHDCGWVTIAKSGILVCSLSLFLAIIEFDEVRLIYSTKIARRRLSA